MNPLVSICIPTYNTEDYIEETLHSILNQTYNNVEIIIGDNASTDKTCEIINENIKGNEKARLYINDVNIGYAANCNKLIESANGKYVAIYHADDIYHQDIVKSQVEILEKYDNLVGSFTRNKFIDQNSIEIKKSMFDIFTVKSYRFIDRNKFIDTILNTNVNPLFCPSSMIRRSYYTLVGGYDQSKKYIEDQDMWLRLLEHGQLVVLNSKLVNYRVHPSQGSYIYIDPNRAELSPMIAHLKDWLELHGSSDKYNREYKHKIERLIAVDHIRMAFHLAKNGGSFEDYRVRLAKSKEVKSIGINFDGLFKYSIFQIAPPFITYKFIS